MARTVRDANLETRTARLRLAIRTEPYWRKIVGLIAGATCRTSTTRSVCTTSATTL
jgi:hypothetical protein